MPTVTSIVCWCCVLSWLPMAALGGFYRGCYGTNQTYCFTSMSLNGYRADDFLKSYSNASAWCRQQGLRLTTVENEAKHRALLEFMLDHEYNSDSLWIDARLQSGDITWTWVNETPFNETATNVPTPSVPPSLKYKAISGIWNSSRKLYAADSSSDRYGYICQYQKSLCSALQQTYDDPSHHYVSSSSRSNVIVADNACYIIFPLDNTRATKSWYNARDVCLYHGGDLATDITSFMAKVQQGLDSLSLPGYWIGLHQQQPVWFNNSLGPSRPIMYNAFPRSTPAFNENTTCLALQLDDRHLTFRTQSCNSVILFVCDTEGASDTTASTENPEVMFGPINRVQFIGIVVGCVIFYVLSIVLVAVIVGCVCSRKHRAPSAKSDSAAHQATATPNAYNAQHTVVQSQNNVHGRNYNNNNIDDWNRDDDDCDYVNLGDDEYENREDMHKARHVTTNLHRDNDDDRIYSDTVAT